MERTDAIGGYFGLELAGGRPLHEGLCEFRTIRGALRLLLPALARQRGRGGAIHLPRFLCPSVIDALAAMPEAGRVRWYNLQETLEPGEIAAAPEDIVYEYNVFGLLNHRAGELRHGSIWDNAHAFFAVPPPGVHTLYSARKFFGVPDGAYLSSDVPVSAPPAEADPERGLFLLARHEKGAEAGYEGFRISEAALGAEPPLAMTALARRILASIDYHAAGARRRGNFERLHAGLERRNGLREQISRALPRPDFVPFSYPLLVADAGERREQLRAERIYTPHLWRGLEERPGLTRFERRLANDVIHLPVDQRYGPEEMDEMLYRLS